MRQCRLLRLVIPASVSLSRGQLCKTSNSGWRPLGPKEHCIKCWSRSSYSEGRGVGKLALSSVPYINSPVLAYSPDDATFDAAIAKSS